MTDLNNLFLRGIPSVAPTFAQNKPYSSFQQPARPQSRNLFGTTGQGFQQVKKAQPIQTISPTLTTPLRRTQQQLAKTTVQNSSMLPQIEYFKRISNQQLTRKILAITVPLILLGMLGLANRKICFELVLFGASLMLNESFIVENKSLRIFIKTLPALTYLALFYDVLTEANCGGEYFVTLANLPVLVISLAALFNFLFLKKMQFLSQQNLHNVEFHSKVQEIAKYFYRKYVSRMKNSIKLSLYVLTLNFLMAFVFIINCILNLNNTLFTETVYTIPAGVIAFVLIDIYVYSIEFLTKDISFFNLRKKFHHVHVSMSLLRLKSSSLNRQENSKIQERCLLEIVKQLKHNSEYLDIPVKVNYAINTYRDIFEIYASEELSLLQTTISDLVFIILRNNKIAKSTKTYKEDLFIKARKLYAALENNYLILNILSEIEKKKILFLIIAKLAQDSPLRTKILQAINDIKESAKKATKAQEYFQIGERKLNDWINELETLQKSLKNSSVGMKVSTVWKDENGWGHYMRKNVLQIQSI